MGRLRWGPAVFKGFLMLVFPLMASGAAQATVKNETWSGDEGSSRLPVASVRRFKVPRELMRFLKDHAGDFNPYGMDQAVWRLLVLQTQCLKSYRARLFSDTISPVINRYPLPELLRTREIREENIKNLVRDILADGLVLSTAEGMVDAEIDYPAISAQFGRYTSPPLTGYLRIMARETARHFGEDAALKINPDILGRRIVAIETFLKQNPRFQKRHELAQLAQKYFTAYLLGLNNTPAFSCRTGRLSGLFLQSYRRSILNYPRTRFAATIQDYLRVLAEHDFQKTEPVLEVAARTAANF